MSGEDRMPFFLGIAVGLDIAAIVILVLRFAHVGTFA